MFVSTTTPGPPREIGRLEKFQARFVFFFPPISHCQMVCLYKTTWGSERLNARVMVWRAAKVAAWAAKADIRQCFFGFWLESGYKSNNQSGNIRIQRGMFFFLFRFVWRVNFVYLWFLLESAVETQTKSGNWDRQVTGQGLHMRKFNSAKHGETFHNTEVWVIFVHHWWEK